MKISRFIVEHLIVRNPFSKYFLSNNTIQNYKYYSLAVEHRTIRLPVIQSELDGAPPGFVFLAGNSHAELIGIGELKGFSIVNGGIGGTSARGYASLLTNIHFDTRAKIAIIFVGSNDMLTSKTSQPLKESQAVAFDAAVTAIIDWLQKNSDTVFVAAVPPIGTVNIPIEPLAVKAYSLRLENLCREHKCNFFDPFIDMRDESTGFAHLGTMASDGIHFIDYHKIRTRIVNEITQNW